MKTAIIVFLIIPAMIFAFVLIKEKRADKINLCEYQTSVDYGDLNAEQIAVMNDILSCSTTGETVIKHNLSRDEFESGVLSYLALYFGSSWQFRNVALYRTGYAEVNLELLRTLEQEKIVIDAKIDNIVSEMYEGTDEFKLLQISNYLATTMQYSYAFADIEPLSGLAGKGCCITYSILFYKMAMRIGIKTYICVGEVYNGLRVASHAWNMVVLDGEKYFYDVTWYDTIIPNPWYLHSKTGWGRNYTLRFD